jgi:hypothetical protein
LEYSDGYLREMLPPGYPPPQYVPGEVVREIESRAARERRDDEGLVARSVLWTYAIFSELALGNFEWNFFREPWPFMGLFDPTMAMPRVTVGLYDPKAEQAGFGLCINLPRWDGPPFYVAGQFAFPRLERRFPIAFRSVTTELHTAPNPAVATTTCWAQDRVSGNWGIVTAGHAVGSVPGVSIPLDNGSAGISSTCYYQPIDAAFVLTSAPAVLPAPLPVALFPAAGTPVEVETQSGPQSRTVASAANSQGFYKTRLFPILFYLDKPFGHGDSGSLIRLVSGEACGIYNGAQPSPQSGGTSGLALHFGQAMFALDTIPYR